MTKIFIDNNWQEYDYDTLYSERGYTNTQSTMLVVYDNSMVQLEGWSNTGFNWIEQDHQWYPNDETPYYVQQSSSISLYKIDKKTNFKIYLNNNEPFIIYNNSFTTVENLHNTLGYTQTPSTVWDIDDGVPWSWYNSDTEEYWNNKTHEWTTNPPTPEDNDEEPPILPNPMPLVEVDYSYDFDEPIMLGGLRTYVPHYAQKEWALGELLQPVESDFSSVDLIHVWADEYTVDLPLYVVNIDGKDFQGIHYNYGDSLLVDRLIVMVDPQGEDTFYKDLDTYIFPYLYDSLSVSLKHYWVEADSRYYTESELLLLGFTTTPQTLCYYTELPLTYNSPKMCSYHEDNGYYVNDRWYSNVNDLNIDGYYLVNKVSKHIYLHMPSTATWNYDIKVINSTTSFKTGSSYIKSYYLDSDLTQPFLWDGHDWFVDVDAVYHSEYYKSNIHDMPASTTSNYSSCSRLLTLITISGNPLTPFINEEINTQVYLHIATNYYSDLSTDGKIFKDLIIMYWELV